MAALPERQGALGRGVDTAVILTRGTGEAAEELLGLCRDAVINLDDPDGAVQRRPQGRVWTISERRDEADVTAKTCACCRSRTEFEAVTGGGICRLSVPLARRAGALSGAGGGVCGAVLRHWPGGERPAAAPGGAGAGGHGAPGRGSPLPLPGIFEHPSGPGA